MEDGEIEKAVIHHIGEIVEYVPHSVFAKTIFKKPTGAITIIAFDVGAGVRGEIYPYETFLLSLEGTAEIILDENLSTLKAFEGIIIPPHASYVLKAIERVKMLSVIIKSGYED